MGRADCLAWPIACCLYATDRLRTISTACPLSIELFGYADICCLTLQLAQLSRYDPGFPSLQSALSETINPAPCLVDIPRIPAPPLASRRPGPAQVLPCHSRQTPPTTGNNQLTPPVGWVAWHPQNVSRSPHRHRHQLRSRPRRHQLRRPPFALALPQSRQTPDHAAARKQSRPRAFT